MNLFYAFLACLTVALVTAFAGLWAAVQWVDFTQIPGEVVGAGIGIIAGCAGVLIGEFVLWRGSR